MNWIRLARVCDIHISRGILLPFRCSDGFGEGFRARLFGDTYQDLLDSTDSSGVHPCLLRLQRPNPAVLRQDQPLKDKIQLLLSNGAMLLRNEVLPGGSPFRRLTRDPGVILCVQVRGCLIQWFTECHDECDGYMLQELCSNWIVHFPQNPRRRDDDCAESECLCRVRYRGLTTLLMLPQQQAAITIFYKVLTISKAARMDCSLNVWHWS
ncbi:hypothetical protein GQ600_22941 [Phytophthora cactorum]|nr:hypothetical protein GQ600_22941 [Phytophthora cactorum]